MKQMKKRTNRKRQLTDAELRRAWDYSPGDIVSFVGLDEMIIGTIADVRLSNNLQRLLYQVWVNTEKGPRFILARGDQIRFIKHGDEI